MYELQQVGEHSYYINCPAKIGIYSPDNKDVYLIDSGNDKKAGSKVRQILDEQGWSLKAIFNTHSHADHIGGNKYLQNQTGCKIYVPGIDCAMTRHTLLEPAFLYGGLPCSDLRHKFLMAQESGAEYLTGEALPEGMESIALPGHAFDMVGFRTKDNVVFLADCLSSGETLEKYQISFLYDPAAYLDTLEKVKAMEANVFVPAHAPASENIVPLAQLNMDKVHEIADKICELCAKPRIFEDILKALFDEYGLTLSFEQYVLVGSTVRSYLSWLKDAGRLSVRFEENRLLWERI